MKEAELAVAETEKRIKADTPGNVGHPYFTDPRYGPLGYIKNQARDAVRHGLFGTFAKLSMGWGRHRDPSGEAKYRALHIVDGLISEISSQEQTINRLAEESERLIARIRELEGK